jgi:hypothetical protein
MERTTRTVVSILGVFAVGSLNVMAGSVPEARPADALITPAPVIPRYLAAQLGKRDIPVTDPRFVGWGTLDGQSERVFYEKVAAMLIMKQLYRGPAIPDTHIRCKMDSTHVVTQPQQLVPLLQHARTRIRQSLLGKQ